MVTKILWEEKFCPLIQFKSQAKLTKVRLGDTYFVRRKFCPKHCCWIILQNYRLIGTIVLATNLIFWSKLVIFLPKNRSIGLKKGLKTCQSWICNTNSLEALIVAWHLAKSVVYVQFSAFTILLLCSRKFCSMILKK